MKQEAIALYNLKALEPLREVALGECHDVCEEGLDEVA